MPIISTKIKLIAISCSVIALSVMGWEGIPTQKDFIRLCLSAALCYFLITGKNWARWIMVALMVLATITAFKYIASTQVRPSSYMKLYLMVTIYMTSSAKLALSSEMRKFFTNKT